MRGPLSALSLTPHPAFPRPEDSVYRFRLSLVHISPAHRHHPSLSCLHHSPARLHLTLEQALPQQVFQNLSYIKTQPTSGSSDNFLSY